MIYSDIAPTIGKTPLIRLRSSVKGLLNTFLVKTESRNPAGSVKCRIAFSMIDDAQKCGKLKPGMTIIEATSGNTGIGLASMGKAHGYDVAIVMPESMSMERKQIIKGLGAELILTPAAEGMKGAIAKAESLVKNNPDMYYMPKQFENPANPAIHAITTGPEIDIDSGGDIDAIVAGVGTGGTITGIGWYFKNIKKSNVKLIAVEPEESPVITQKLQGREHKPSPHKIQGIGAGFIPKVLDLAMLDEVVTVNISEAIFFARKLMTEEGILCGISGGAAFAGAVKISDALGWENKIIAVILPDSGERYLSTDLYEKDFSI